MRPSLDWDVLHCYLASEATPEEVTSVRAWVSEDTRRAQLLASLQGGNSVLGRPVERWDTNAMWSRFSERQATLTVLDNDESSVHPSVHPHNWERPSRVEVPPLGDQQVRSTFASLSSPQRTSVLRHLPLWGFAAVAVLCLGLFGYFKYTNGPVSDRQATTQSAASRLIVTTRGQRSSFELADGSRLVVAPASRLSIPDDYGVLERRIIIDEGEAYIEVVHDPLHPFIVQTSGTSTRVLGTKFTVRKYKDDSTVRIAVVDGKVAVGRTVLSAGEVANVESNGLTTVHIAPYLDPYIGWINGHLTFLDRPFGEVVTELSRAYDVEIRIESPELYRHRVTAVFDNQSLHEMLRDLSIAVNARLEQYSNIAILRAR